MSEASVTTALSLELPKQLTIDNADQVFKQLLSGSDESHIIVDLSCVEHSDSAGLAALVEVKAVLLSQKQTICYCHPAQQLKDLARFFKIDSILFG